MIPRASLAVILLVASAVGTASLLFGPLESVSNRLLDRQFATIRYLEPAGESVRPFIIGIDDATYEAFAEPFALWHPHFADLLQSLAVHRPAVVAFDVALPTKDFSAMGSDGPYDASLIAALAQFRRISPNTLLLFATAVEQEGEGWQLLLPDRRLLAPLRPDESRHFAHPLIAADADGRLRRIQSFDTPVPSLAAAVVSHLGVEPAEGLIDYRIGGRLNYLAMHDFLSEYDHEEAMLAGRVVLVGDVTPFGDRVSLPVALSTWMLDEQELPGVLAHAQIIRTLTAEHRVRPVGHTSAVVAVLGAAAFSLLALGPVAALAVLVAVAVLLVVLSTGLLHMGLQWDVVPVLLTLLVAIGFRQLMQARAAIAQRRQLKTLFGGYVSPAVLHGIMDGSIPTGLDGHRREIAVLFSDVRGFTTRSEKAEPEHIIRLLNRYFDAMVPIVHRHGGTVDKFLGDGLMVLFGAPGTRESPALDAVNAAREMLDELARLNEKLAAEGEPALGIGIGIHLGPAVVGHVGSRLRHEYTAIGDTVNLAARLESLTKGLGHPVVFSAAVATQIEGRYAVQALGVQEVKGREAVPVFTLSEKA